MAKTILAIGAVIILFIVIFFGFDIGRENDTNIVITPTEEETNNTSDSNTLDSLSDNNDTQDQDNETDNNDQTNQNNQIQVSYTTYTNSDLDFQILRPTGSQAQSEGSNRVKFTFLGPLNESGTEITDGFTLTIFKDEAVASTTSLRAYAENRLASTRENNTILTSLENRTVNGLPAYRYSYRNQLGSNTWEYVFKPSSNLGYTASYTISDPNNRNYQAIVFNMLESITFN